VSGCLACFSFKLVKLTVRLLSSCRTCRGTLGLSDVLVDLTCDYEPIQVEGGAVDEEYSVHGGMLYVSSPIRIFLF
jgi:hypothetical protein